MIAISVVLSPFAAAQEGDAGGSKHPSLPLHAVRGHLYLDGTNEGLEGFRTYLCQRWTVLGEAKTDGNGFFEFGLIRMPPRKLRLVVGAPLEIYTVPPETVQLPAGGGDVDVTLYARCVFDATYVRNLLWEGRVFQWDGVEPVEGAEATLRREQYTIGRAQTDGHGFFKFLFHDLPPGPYTLTVMTGNDLLQAASSTLDLGERDAYRNESLVLQSPLRVPLRRSTILGRIKARYGATWATAGAEVRFGTGPHVLGTTTVGEGGGFQREKLYVPPGRILVEVLPRFGLLRPGKTTLEMPATDPRVSTVRAEVRMSPAGRWWGGVLLVPVVVGACLWAILRCWVFPEWRAVRRGMVASSSRSAESGMPARNEPCDERDH